MEHLGTGTQCCSHVWRPLPTPPCSLQYIWTLASYPSNEGLRSQNQHLSGVTGRGVLSACNRSSLFCAVFCAVAFALPEKPSPNALNARLNLLAIGVVSFGFRAGVSYLGGSRRRKKNLVQLLTRSVVAFMRSQSLGSRCINSVTESSQFPWLCLVNLTRRSCFVGAKHASRTAHPDLEGNHL